MKLLTFTFLLLNFSSPLNNSKSGSMSQSKSGYLNVLHYDGTSYKWTKEYYYIYAYQYAFIRDFSVENENHNFNFSGYLDKGGDLNLIGLTADRKYLCYENNNYYLKIPFESGESIFFRPKVNNSCEMTILGYDALNNWQCISND